MAKLCMLDGTGLSAGNPYSDFGHGALLAPAEAIAA